LTGGAAARGLKRARDRSDQGLPGNLGSTRAVGRKRNRGAKGEQR
jgi:hypothetical protein